MSTDTATRVRGRSIDHVRALVHELIIAKDLAREKALETPKPEQRGLWNKLMPPPVKATPDPFTSSPFTKAEIFDNPHVDAIAVAMRYDVHRRWMLAETIYETLTERSVSEARLDAVIRGFLRKYPPLYVPCKKAPS